MDKLENVRKVLGTGLSTEMLLTIKNIGIVRAQHEIGTRDYKGRVNLEICFRFLKGVRTIMTTMVHK